MRSPAGVLWAVVALAVVAEWALAHHAPGAPWWHTVPGVQAAYGIAGCVAIVLVSKWLGRRWLQRPEPEGAGARVGTDAPGPRT